MARFPCNCCGQCCRNVGNNVTLAKWLMKEGRADAVVLELANFPYTFDDNGVCEKLKDNKCSIYKTRPDICSVYTIWQKYLKGKMTQRQFYELNQKACKKLGNA